MSSVPFSRHRCSIAVFLASVPFSVKARRWLVRYLLEHHGFTASDDVNSALVEVVEDTVVTGADVQVIEPASSTASNDVRGPGNQTY